MPFYLKERNILKQAAGLKRVLIVPCRFCPAATLAVKEQTPFIELFRRFLKTGAYETYIHTLRHRLGGEGVAAEVFDSHWPHHYVACMWTSGRRKKLGHIAKNFDGVLVLGCEATIGTVRDALGTSEIHLIQGMEVEGIMTVLPKIAFPFNISLTLKSITRVVMDK